MELTVHALPEPPRRLQELLGRRGEAVAVEGSRPLPLDVANHGWLVVEGRLEVFSVLGSGERRGARRHLGSCAPGEIALGAAVDPERRSGVAGGEDRLHRLIAVPHSETRLISCAAGALTDPGLSPGELRALAWAFDGWVERLLGRLAWQPVPAEPLRIRPGGEIAEGGAERSACPDGRPVWLLSPRGGWFFLGEPELPLLPDAAPLPLPRGAWVTTEDRSPLLGLDCERVLSRGEAWSGIAYLYRLFFRAQEIRERDEAEAEHRRCRRRREADGRALAEVHEELASILGARGEPGEEVPRAADPLSVACRLVLEHQGARCVLPEEDVPSSEKKWSQRLGELCDANGIRYRRVKLGHRWQRRGRTPLVGFADFGETGQLRPVALLPYADGYELVDPSSGARGPLDEEAVGLDPEAYELLSPQLAQGPTLRRILEVSLGRRGELKRIGALTLGGGALGLVVPLFVAIVYGRVIPDGARSELLPLVLGLVAVALGSAAFQITRSLAVLRVLSQVDGVVQMSVFDRLLRLPAAFFRRFSVGDLANRSLGVDAIRELLPADVTGALLGLAVSAASLGVLFFLSWELALVALALVFVLGASATLLIRLQLLHERRLLEVQGRISSLIFNLIQGIPKLRVSGSEGRAYCRWAHLFAKQRRSTFEAQRVAQLQRVLIAVYPLAAELALFAWMGLFLSHEVGVARFLAFSTAFGQLQVAVLTIVLLLPEMLSIAPTFERLRPILEAELEVAPGRQRTGTLAGRIEVCHLSFRYHADGPLVLDDVSLEARPGEFVALVGPSGSGKSTLLRLLLGFERPEAGSISYDGKDLASLDPGSVRSQLGVVLQGSRPIAGDIYTNIVGSSHLGIEEAWAAARMAGLEADIEAMPMGMHTIVGEGATTFSGGQRQRLMIARALVRRPRILLLDEATSALDNPTQELVRRSLGRLEATRFIIAHRLSTIRHADRIYVLDQGKIVERGCYEELVRNAGLFSRLVERQTAGLANAPDPARAATP